MSSPGGPSPSAARRVPAAVAVVLLLAGTAAARPIRTNTPGTGIFIGSGVLVQAICERLERGRASLEGCALVADLRYSPATHWVLGARAPLHVDRESSFAGTRVSANGPGDLEISGKWRFYREVGPWFDRHAAVELGIKLPTGESDLPAGSALPLPLAHRLTPGTGSTDAFVDLVFQQGRRRFVWGGDLMYRRNGEGEGGYRLGDLVRLSLDGEYVLFPRVYTRPGHEVFVLLEPSLVHRRDDEARGRRLPTGGTELLLAPGVQYIATEQMLLSASVQLPLWSDVGRAGLERGWNVLAEIRYAF